MNGPDLNKFTTLDGDAWMRAPFNVSTLGSHWEASARRYLLVAKKTEKAVLNDNSPPVRALLYIVGLLQQYPKNSVTVSLEKLRQDVGNSDDSCDSIVIAGLPVNHQILVYILGQLSGERVRVWNFPVSADEPCLVLDDPSGEWRVFLMGLDRVYSSAKKIKLIAEGDQEEPKEKLEPEESEVDMDEVFSQWS